MTPLLTQNSHQSVQPTKSFIYARVSSIKQKTDGDGLNMQIGALQNYAKYKNLEVAGIFCDAMTGTKKDRPDMERMLNALRKTSEPHAVLIFDVSRLARSIPAHIELRSEISAAGGVLMSPSIEFSDDPKAQLPEKILFVVQEHYAIETAARSKAGTLARMKSGYWALRAPTGYAYTKEKSKAGSVLVRDEPVASVVKEALEKFASGILGSQVEVKRFLEDHPQFPKTASGKIGKSRVKRLLTLPVYAGYIEHKDYGIPLTKAQHEPLISFETYLKIQDRLNGTLRKQAVRLDINPDFPLRGLVNCAECGIPLRAGRSKGRSRYYHYYACHTKECSSYGKSIKKDKVEGEFEALLTTLRPAPELLEIVAVMFKAVWDKHMSAFKGRQQAAKHTLGGIEKKIDNLVNRIVATSQPKLITAYEGELVKLENQRIATSEQIERLNGQNGAIPPDFNTAYRTALAFLTNPCFLWHSSQISHKRMVVKLAFAWQLSYDRNKGYRTTQNSLPFQIIQRLSNTKKEKNMLNERMVDDTGIEPVTPTMSM